MFNIINVSRISSDRVKVIVTMSGFQWTITRDKGGLGGLYGVDISNTVYREYGVMACNPTVKDTDRAKNGLKTIELIYDDSAWAPAVDNVIRVDFKTRKRVA